MNNLYKLNSLLNVHTYHEFRELEITWFINKVFIYSNKSTHTKIMIKIQT